ncbi:protein NO VEIN-like [Zingiber officinale]|uniref:protein NO VEIN-like n=1 Tax=Zingiber officinale TaxID=94328 RepID=UPI001C4CEDD0|nr:protein NO VEIN-like [Zingiber officinale]
MHINRKKGIESVHAKHQVESQKVHGKSQIVRSTHHFHPNQQYRLFGSSSIENSFVPPALFCFFLWQCSCGCTRSCSNGCCLLHPSRARREDTQREVLHGRDDKNPLADDIHQAVLYLSEELYSKDAHFLMELVQNAEDNKYAEGVTPSLEFLITSKDITMTGAKTTLLLFNNEIGFSPSNIDSICRIGKSTKKGKRHLGYIGEKGFKSVFLISSKPYIFSNGYQICFNEEPSPDCNLGYIVPEWVDENPNLSDIKNLYGPSESLLTTIIILPLNIEKESAVKEQLSNLQLEVLLFLSKIRQLSVRGDTDDSKCNTGCKISITGEDNCQTGYGKEHECRIILSPSFCSRGPKG